MITKPYRHQLSGLAFCLSRDYAALFWEPGCGKSFAALAVAEARGARLLVVGPSRLATNWQKQSQVHRGTHMTIYAGTNRDRALASDSMFIGYEMIRMLMDPRRHVKLKTELKLAKQEGRAPVIDPRAEERQKFIDWIKAKPTLVVADESHRLKDPMSKQSMAMSEVGAMCRWRIIMSGTPVAHDLLDLFSQMRVLSTDILGYPTKTAFLKHTCDEIRRPYMPVPEYRLKPGKGDWIMARTRAVTHTRRSEDCLDLPPLVFETIEVDLSPEARKAYDEVKRVAQTVIADETSTAFSKMAELYKLRGIASGVLRMDEGNAVEFNDPKLDVIRDIVEDSGGDHVAVWTSGDSRDENDHVARALGSKMIDGRTAMGDRLAEIAEWSARPAPVEPLVLSVKACGEGIDIVTPRLAVFHSLPWSQVEMDQACRRLWRSGQKRSVRVTRLVARNTVDTQILKALEEKADILSVVMRDGVC